MGNTNWNPWVKGRRERRKKKEKKKEEKEEEETLKLGEKGGEDGEGDWSVCDYNPNMLHENLKVEKRYLKRIITFT